MAVTKSGTGCGTRGCWDMGLGDAGTWGRGTWGRGDAGTRGYDKQMTPEFFAEFVIYNFWWSYAGEFACRQVADNC